MQSKHLRAIHSLPYVAPSGRVIRRGGWDTETQIYLHLPHTETQQVQHKPTGDEVRAALAVMAVPFSGYQWATPDDAAAMLSGVITAVVRPALELAPMYLIDASTQGSGKTKAATALGALMTGERPGVTPFSGLDDDELRKRIISGVLTSQQFHCVDNIVGRFESPALAGVLTSGRLADRVLGSSRTVTAAIRALFTATSNNAHLGPDLLRRTVRVRIDSGVNPTARRFDFDPVDLALRDRMRIAQAVCTVLAAYFAAGAPRIADDDAGGFTDWVRLCRQPLLWVTREGLSDHLPWELGDPAASMLVSPDLFDSEVDAHGDLLLALHGLSEGTGFTSRDVLKWWKAGVNNDEGPFAALSEALAEFYTGRTEPTAKSLGRVLMHRRDRAVRGLRLRTREDSSSNARVWRVVPV